MSGGYRVAGLAETMTNSVKLKLKLRLSLAIFFLSGFERPEGKYCIGLNILTSFLPYFGFIDYINFGTVSPHWAVCTTFAWRGGPLLFI